MSWEQLVLGRCLIKLLDYGNRIITIYIRRSKTFFFFQNNSTIIYIECKKEASKMARERFEYQCLSDEVSTACNIEIISKNNTYNTIVLDIWCSRTPISMEEKKRHPVNIFTVCGNSTWSSDVTNIHILRHTNNVMKIWP